MWKLPGRSALTGEDSILAALREVKEVPLESGQQSCHLHEENTLPVTIHLNIRLFFRWISRNGQIRTGTRRRTMSAAAEKYAGRYAVF